MTAPRTGRPALLAIAIAALAGLALFMNATLTAAALSDSAWLGLGSDGALGGSNRFQVGLVTDPTIVDKNVTEGVVSMLDDPDAIDWAVSGAAGFVPGKTLKMQVPVFNDSEALFADMQVTLESRGKQTKDISDYLTISARDLTSGTELFADQYLSQLAKSPGTFALAPRGDAGAHQDGDAYVPGAKGSAKVIEFELHYAEKTATGAQDTASLNGGTSLLRIVFDAASRAE
ncbi:hypothetical protein [Leucobacter tardus]|uniref:Uncharacterized protein n=1 Tax=Leucobacter tardus TaxID=501483 RepID=A0A939QMZ6_9MICO|nr:hypothetical protein [Leucobacter tardus]MBO2990684.1 hypothetical protein [Leucobacter tardus]